MEWSRTQGMDYQEEIDNVVLAIKMYDHSSCSLAAN